MKTFVIGDIHGRFEALKEVLTVSKFNYKEDKLILLGDIVDGGYNTYLVVEELLKIKNLIFVLGNHDEMFMTHISSGWAEEIWLQQGGANTLQSYGSKIIKLGRDWNESTKMNNKDLNIPVTHQEFFNKAVYYHIEDNMCFVHGGFNPKIPKMESQSKFDLLWDRNLIEYAKKNIIKQFDKVFVGHSTTQSQGDNIGIDNCLVPIKFNNLIMMDCGAGWNGCLAIMDINTEEHWVSKIQNPIVTPTLTEDTFKTFLDETKKVK